MNSATCTAIGWNRLADSEPPEHLTPAGVARRRYGTVMDDVVSHLVDVTHAGVIEALTLVGHGAPSAELLVPERPDHHQPLPAEIPDDMAVTVEPGGDADALPVLPDERFWAVWRAWPTNNLAPGSFPGRMFCSM